MMAMYSTGSIVRWREFDRYDRDADRWRDDGNIVIMPSFTLGRNGGEARFMVAGTRATFIAACRNLRAEPNDIQARRCAINIDGVFLLKALFLCRHQLATVPESGPWETRCPTCGLPVDRVASHERMTGGAAITKAACAANHTWPV